MEPPKRHKTLNIKQANNYFEYWFTSINGPN